MSTNNPDIAVALYDQHSQAENAVKALQRAGFEMIFGGLQGAVVVGGVSALAGALMSIGIPKDSVLRYETKGEQIHTDGPRQQPGDFACTRSTEVIRHVFLRTPRCAERSSCRGTCVSDAE